MADSVLDDGDGALFALASRVIAQNREAGRCIVLAESCTGGMVATALTDVPGSSDVLEASFVTYSNAAKHRLLSVPEAVFREHGAVSIACAEAMANGALDAVGAGRAVAITGIAGPGGGSAAKPVGTVAFGWAAREASGTVVHSRLCHFAPDGGRAAIRRQAALFALNLLASDDPDALPDP